VKAAILYLRAARWGNPRLDYHIRAAVDYTYLIVGPDRAEQAVCLSVEAWDPDHIGQPDDGSLAARLDVDDNRIGPIDHAASDIYLAETRVIRELLRILQTV
jgi:hypothetical protein